MATDSNGSSAADIMPLQASLDAEEIWYQSTHAERRDIILTHVPWQQWLEETYLQTLVVFRHEPVWWARITERYRALGGREWALRDAADERAPTTPLSRTQHANGTQPDLDMTSEGLLVRYPALAEDLSRPYGLTDAQHEEADARLMTVCIQEQWPDGVVVTALINAHASGHHDCDPVKLECQLGTTYLRLQGMESTADEAVERAHRIGKAKALHHLSTLWHIPLVKIIRHGTDENTLWHLILRDGREVSLGNDLENQKKVSAAIYNVTGKMIPRVSVKELRKWHDLMELLFDIAETVATPELTRAGQIKALVLSYLETERCELTHETSSEEWENLAQSNRPFILNGMIHLHARHFWLHHARIMAPDINHAQLLDLLRLLGGVADKIPLNEKKTSRYLWKIALTALQDDGEVSRK